MAKNRIKELRENHKLKLRNLVELLAEKGIKVNESQLSKFEKGTIPRNEDIWEALAEIFDTSAYYVMGYDIDEKELTEFFNNVNSRMKRLSDRYKEDTGKDEPNIKELKKYASEKIEEGKFKEVFYNLNEANRNKWIDYGKDLSKLQDLEEKIRSDF